MIRPEVTKVIGVVRACDEMARRVGLRFILDEEKLEWLGFTSVEIDHIFESSEVDPNVIVITGS